MNLVPLDATDFATFEVRDSLIRQISVASVSIVYPQIIAPPIVVLVPVVSTVNPLGTDPTFAQVEVVSQVFVCLPLLHRMDADPTYAGVEVVERVVARLPPLHKMVAES